ncbi:MAG: Rid family detoxifying hydrolase [Synergistaceae bacterium]|jgi:2-iminobutanoate/2-iminopropanoate deaminase|nr:Rid family detoxifying hydrolase [Synergistaceae bacterium]
MAKREIKTNRAPKPLGQYSQGVISGNRIYVSGQYPVDSEKRGMPTGVAAQTRQVLTNVRNIIEAGGGKINNIIMCTIYLANLGDFNEFNTVYAEFFKAPYPACTIVGCVLNPGVLIEINAIAEI